MLKIVDITTVLPLRHALVLVAPLVLLPHPVRVPDEEGANLLLYTEVNDLPRGLMAQVAHPPLDAACHGVPGMLQLFPAPGVLLAPRLFLSYVSMSHVRLALEAADSSP